MKYSYVNISIKNLFADNKNVTYIHYNVVVDAELVSNAKATSQETMI